MYYYSTFVVVELLLAQDWQLLSDHAGSVTRRPTSTVVMRASQLLLRFLPTLQVSVTYIFGLHRVLNAGL